MLVTVKNCPRYWSTLDARRQLEGRQILRCVHEVNEEKNALVQECFRAAPRIFHKSKYRQLTASFKHKKFCQIEPTKITLK